MRAYTVHEIDALRSACEARYLYGTTRMSQGSQMSRVFRQDEKAKEVEEMARTYMLAGITAEDIYRADNPPSEVTTGAAAPNAGTQEKK